jgi:hypothetical protein
VILAIQFPSEGAANLYESHGPLPKSNPQAQESRTLRTQDDLAGFLKGQREGHVVRYYDTITRLPMSVDDVIRVLPEAPTKFPLWE